MFKDVLFAARGLRKHPGFSAIAILTIALGIGACTAIFSVVHAVLLRPLPYADGSRLAVVWGELRARHVNDWPFSSPDYRDVRQHSKDVFEDVAGLSAAGRAPISANEEEPEQILVAAATTNLFRVLGARIIVGRDFIDDDGIPQPQAGPPQAGPPQAGQPAPPRLPTIAVISYGLWQRRFGGDPAVVNRMVDLGNGRAQIVGVLAPDFEILFAPRANIEHAPDAWTAARINYDTANRFNVQWRLIARLKPNATFDQAQAQLDRLAADERDRFPIATTAGLYFHVVPMQEDLVRDVRPALLSVMGAVAFVLLIACANVANLLIVRASGRSRELAICAAIGGNRWQLIRQMLAESMLVAAGGTALGIGLAQAGIRVLMSLGPKDLPRLDAINIDPVVLTFAIATGAVTSILCGIVPALRASRADVMDVLRSVGGRSAGLRSGRRLRSVVVVAEVALSFVLLIGAGLMVRSVVVLTHVNPGFDPDHVVTFLQFARSPQEGQREAFNQQLRERIKNIPGVVSVSAATPLPLDGALVNARWGTETALTDQTKFRQANTFIVQPGYFETMRTPIIAGRSFSDVDNHVDRKTNMPKQVVIDDQVAAIAFPNENPVGKRILARVNTPEAEWFDVIGVVAHQRHASLAAAGPEGLYFADGYFGHGAAGRWAVRTTGDPMQIVPAVRAAITALDARAVPAEIKPMQAFVDRAMAPLRFTTTLITVFGVVAVIMAAIGLYGVLATIVRQRTAEIGMRLVFGAQRSSILRLIVGEGLRLSGAGIVVGALTALAVTRVMRSLLVGVGTADPITFASITVLFVAIAVAASVIPARRAASVDPMVALRNE
ncbi:MAG TPA: ABC transporter permease [Vicinamibacterales bacterium]|nr:ABC transporter permease [Vicinamibacterales bacterium]